MLAGTTLTTTTPAKIASTEVPKTEASTTSFSINTSTEIAGETKREGVVSATVILPTLSTASSFSSSSSFPSSTSSSSSSSSSSTYPYLDPRFSTAAISSTSTSSSSSSSSTSDYPTLSATTVSAAAPVPLSADPLKAALQAHYRTKDHLPGLLTDHKQPIADINLSIIEYQAQITRAKETKATDSKTEIKESKAADEALAHYETLHNVSYPIPVADIFNKAPNAEGKLEAKPAKRLLILGPAGVGKTTMSQYLAYQWATGQLWAGQFDYVFWIPLRHLTRATTGEAKTTPSLASVIQRECLATESSLSSADIEKVLREKASRTLVLLDGYDEVAHLLENPDDLPARLLTAALRAEFLILTSRPHQLHHLDLSRFDRRLENTGFTDANIESYVSRYFATLTPPQPEQAKTLLAFLKANPSIWGTAHIPINLALLCDIWQNQLSTTLGREGREIKDVKEDKAESKATSAEAPALHPELSMTGLYQAMTAFLLKRYLEKKGVKTRDRGDIWIMRQCNLELEFLGLLAFDGLQTHQITLTKSLQRQTLERIEAKHTASTSSPFHAILASGFLRASGDSRQEEIDKPHYFIHLTFQEYLAASYLVDALKQDPKTAEHRTARQFLQTEKYTARYQIVLGFMAGLLTAETPKGEASAAFLLFWNTLLSEPWDITGIGHIRLMIRCLEEASCDHRIPHRDTLLKQARNWLLSKEYIADLEISASSLVVPAFRSALKALRHPTVFSQLLAGRKFDIIGELGPVAATPEAVRALLTALSDSDTDSEAKCSAASALGKLGTAAATPEVIQALINTLRDTESWVRCSAARVLGQLGPAATPEVAQALIALLRDKASEVRDAAMVRDSAIQALGKLGAAAATPATLSALIALLQSKDSDVDSEVRYYATRALGQLGTAAATPDVLSALVALLRNTEPEIRDLAANALGYLGPAAATPEVIQALIARLRDTEAEVRYSAAVALGYLGPVTAAPEVIRALTAPLHDTDFDVRCSAARVLGRLGPAATPEVTQALIALLRDKVSEVRDPAIRALGQLGAAAATPATLSALIALLQSKDSDVDSEVRYCATRALGQLGTAAATPDVLSALVALLRNTEPEIRDLAAYALGDLGPAAATPEVIQALIARLRDTEAEVRNSAAFALGYLGPVTATPEIIRALTALLHDTDSYVRCSAAVALGRFGTSAAMPEIMQALIALLRDTDSNVKSAAANALGQLGPAAATSEVIQALSTLLQDMESEEVRNSAEEAFKKLGIATIVKVWLKTQDIFWSEPLAAYVLQRAVPMTLTSTALHIHEDRSSTAIPLPTDKGLLLVESLVNAFAKQARELHLPCQLYEALRAGTSPFPGAYSAAAVISSTSSSSSSSSTAIAVPTPHYSLIKPGIPVTRMNWVVSMLRKPRSDNPDHAYLIVEGLNQFGRGILWCCHLVDNRTQPGQALILIQKWDAIERAEIRGKLLGEYLKGDEFVAQSWGITREQALRLYTDMEKDKVHPPRYHVSGDRSLFAHSSTASGSTSTEAHNCFTWIRKKLTNLGDGRIVIPVRFTDFIGAKTSFYILEPDMADDHCRCLLM